MKLTAVLPAFGLLPAWCATLSGPVTLDTAVTGADRYFTRGLNMNEGGVLQPEAKASLDAGDGGRLGFGFWGNIQLSDDSGDAVLPDANSGKITETDINIS